jgi:hypothetical protein
LVLLNLDLFLPVRLLSSTTSSLVDVIIRVHLLLLDIGVLFGTT